MVLIWNPLNAFSVEMMIARHRALTPADHAGDVNVLDKVEMMIARHRALTPLASEIVDGLALVEMMIARHRALTPRTKKHYIR